MVKNTKKIEKPIRSKRKTDQQVTDIPYFDAVKKSRFIAVSFRQERTSKSKNHAISGLLGGEGRSVRQRLHRALQ